MCFRPSFLVYIEKITNFAPTLGSIVQKGKFAA